MSSTKHSIRRIDVIVTALLAALAWLTVFVIRDQLGTEVKSVLPAWADYMAVGLLILPLVARRRFPLTVGLWIGAGFTAFRLLQVPEDAVSSAALFLVLFSAGAYSTDRRMRNIVRGVITGLAFVALFIAIFRSIDVISFDGAAIASINIGINLFFFVAAWLLGEVWRQRQEAATELEARAVQLAEEREQRAKQAVVEERVRISRELHDVVAHHVSVMGVQAAGARAILDSDPERARAALEAVEESGREAVSELQRLVGYLREGEEADAPSPQPSLEDLDQLVATTRSAGVPVEIRTIGRPRLVPSSVALSAYRIVQEALTNVMKYAGDAETTVVLTYTGEGLGVEVVNQPPTIRRPITPGGGRGMVGMRERAAMLGGTFDAGAIAGGGYRVAADLPTGTSYDTETVGS